MDISSSRLEERTMKGLIVAAVAAISLGGCVAVPYDAGPYYGGPVYYGGPAYYPAPAVGFYGFYSGGGYYRHYHRGRW